MPLTRLDRVAALIVIDLQKGVVGLPLAHAANDVVGRAAQLARAFRTRGLPVVLVNVSDRAPGRTDAGFPKFSFPPDWTDLVPELERQSGDIQITKQRVGAFIGTSLDQLLRESGVTQVFLTGVSTTMGVESTARSAFDHGYHVAFVTDAMTDLDPALHRHAIEKVFPRLGETTTTAQVLKQLEAEPSR